MSTVPVEEQTQQYKHVTDIPVPAGYTRVASATGTFGYYIRRLNFTDDNIVYLYDGSQKYIQDDHIAVFDIDVGTRDLQQCADACMRIWGEYLYSAGKYNDIHFNFLSDGKPRYFKDYAAGDYSHTKFRKYMNYIFSFANTASLYQELKSVSLADLQMGDVFIQPGNPVGHAVMVVDVAENSSGQKIFLLAQSYMPAQSIHVLTNPNGGALENWYSLKEGENLETPEYYFSGNFKLKRFELD